MSVADRGRRPGRYVILVALPVAAAAVNVSGLGLPTAVRALLAVPLLIGPGVALAAAPVLPHELQSTERWVVAAGLSLAVDIFIGLALNFAPGGLDRNNWSIALASVCVLASMVALARGRGAQASESRRRHLPVAGLLAGTVALLAAFAALGLSRQSAIAQQDRSRFTEFWALPNSRHASIISIRFGVKNDERSFESYSIVARSGSGRVLFRIDRFGVAAGASREWRRAVPAVKGLRLVNLDLYRVGIGRLYRHATIWITP